KEEQEKLIKQDPEYGEIICRCQNVTRREIRDAIENRFGARSISSIKYRAWATTGRCNGGYCLAKIVDMLVKDYGMKPEEIDYRSVGSEMFCGEVK
ncbi:MAG TPA: FAD/NAD(P)-binding oxidoreductase, partial [Sphaerochaeta sp.]|nr:FAD/NAD(P)-binding oxidoreductase [Sphaerochaeta sp.]